MYTTRVYTLANFISARWSRPYPAIQIQARESPSIRSSSGTERKPSYLDYDAALRFHDELVAPYDQSSSLSSVY